MAAKKPIFHVAEWEAKQRQKARDSAIRGDKRTKAERQLANAVRRYNDKIARDIKKGKLTQATAPKRLSVREIKKGIDAGLSPLQRGAALSRAARSIGKKQKEDFAPVKTPAGLIVPRAVFEQAKAGYEQAKRKQIEEEAKRVAAEAESPKFGGVSVQKARAWGEGAIPGNPETAKTWEKFAERVEAAQRYNRSGEWSVYRQDLIKNYEKHYTGAELEAMKKALEKLSDSQLEAAFHAGAEFAEQGYHYEAEATSKVDTMIANMEKWANV